MTIDLTKNTAAFGLMSGEERGALEALPKGETEVYAPASDQWVPCIDPQYYKGSVYRQRPTPPLIVDPDLWRHLPKCANWIVGNSWGDVKWSEHHPDKGDLDWHIKGRTGFLGGWQSITFTDPERWEEAKVKRPEGE